MKKFLVPALIGAAMALPAAASAQAVPDAKVGVVDVENVIQTCTACASAWAQLQQQAVQIQQLQQQLGGPLQTEGQAIQAEVNALGEGVQPSEALQQRALAWEQRRQQAGQQLQQREATYNRNRTYVLQQIGAQLDPAYSAVLQRRQVNLIVPANSTLAHSATIDLTNDVLAQLNSTLTSVATVAPAPQQPVQQTPQGR